MACNAQQTLVFDGIKGKEIDISKIPDIPTPPSLKTWYINSAQIVEYLIDVASSSGIYITYNDTSGGVCNKNPIVSCDPCVQVIGTVSMTDAEINEALGKLPFKSGNMGILALAAITIGILYLATKKQ